MDLLFPPESTFIYKYVNPIAVMVYHFQKNDIFFPSRNLASISGREMFQ